MTRRWGVFEETDATHTSISSLGRSGWKAVNGETTDYREDREAEQIALFGAPQKVFVDAAGEVREHSLPRHGGPL